jgi:hypothetical protein
VADEVKTPPQGWYEDPNDPSKLRYWDGSQWTERGTKAAADPSSAVSKSAPIELPKAFWIVLLVATLGILWGAAEQHDQGCYSKTQVQVASGNTSQSNCLFLPWNDPVEGSRTFFR